MSGETALPPGFAALEPFVAGWALPTTAARAARRGEATSDEREQFFAAASPLVASALAHLDARPLHALDPAEQRLLNLLLALAHVGLAVEMQGPAEARHALGRARMQITRAVADAEPGA
ncbi:hypothetical protein ACFOON_02605 [Novosphingobium piscinae]|uniref:Uncharacterized protein n=1 Tax=Novosphingobium piscinae TaxID=1507448 RepID=A0A7X1FW76_9SPHN|nr:hypothetical protein [Novosphingobium piscinae]MBC2667522.1 hypothetical protein [Novosphingobium piscinae]